MVSQEVAMASYMRIALDFLKFSAATDRTILEAAEVLPLIAKRALERVGAPGSLDVGLASLQKEAVAEMAIFHMKVAEAIDHTKSREDALIAGSNAVVAVICFGYIGLYRGEVVQQKLFEACLDRYARSQALVEALL
jgi:hypothetical protein